MAKIAISLPDDVLEAVERERLGRDQKLSRSEFIKIAVEQYLRTERERAETEKTLKTLEEQYIRGYLEHPETEEELDAWVDQASMIGLREFYKGEPPWPDPNE